MDRTPQSILFLLLIFSPSAAQNTTGSSPNEFHVGVILDLGSLVGKVARTSVSLALEDFYASHRNCSWKVVLHFKDSVGNDVQAASAVWALAQAAEKVGVLINKNKRLQFNKNSTCLESLAVSRIGPELLTAIVQNKFRGLSGNFDLTDRQLQVSALQIINVVGRSWRHIGFWTLKNGFPYQLNQNGLKLTMLDSMQQLNPVIWPGESTEVPRGWQLPASANKLRVGVHTSAYPEFIKTSKDPVTNATRASGLSIDIFEEAVKRLPFALAYEYQAFDTVDTQSTGSYNDFVYQVYLQRYDIAIGDITIRYNRTMYVDFTIPYTESGVAMIVPVKEKLAPTVTDIHELQKQGAYVGFHRGSYIEGLLEDIGFDRSKIRPYDTPDDFHIALSNEGRHGGVAALVLEVPYIKLFLAKYCKGYTMVGPIYKSAGFAFALPKRSPLLTEISRAILNITEGDSIIQIEKKWIDQNSCQNEEKVADSGAIAFGNFGGLFLLTGLVTTCSLSIALLRNQYKKGQQINIDHQNQQGQGQQEENGHVQDGDQNNEENGGCNDIENQATTIYMPHSLNTNSDQLGDCPQNNKAIALTHFGSQVTHRGGVTNIGDQVAQV
uniref:Glutamate receptor n=1 Tax=Saccharum hybrid cultivar R570 TaxID=131158 RepID=A0A059Q2S4_9POAL|nr:glutamate receptor [Saccharum hybrid cultivar R570]